MTKITLKKCLARFKWRGLKTLGKDIAGVSALEFALIAPVMVLLYFGGVELSLLMQADRRITNVASTIGDLTSRATIMRNSDIDAVFSSAGILIAPLDLSKAQMRISSIAPAGSGNNQQVVVVWSDARGTTARSVGSQVDDVPNGIVPPGGSVILAEVTYPYQSSLDYLPSAQRTITERFYLRPRRTNNILRVP